MKKIGGEIFCHVVNAFVCVVAMGLLNRAIAAEAIAIDLTGVALASEVRIAKPAPNHLSVEWPAAENNAAAIVTMDFTPGARLVESIAWREHGDLAPQVIAQHLEPCMILTEGTRRRVGVWRVFFDKPWTRPYERVPVERHTTDVKVTSRNARATVTLNGIRAGSFSGRLVLTFYSGVPLIHAETVLTTHEDGRAIIYDAGLVAESGQIAGFTWIDAKSDKTVTARAGEMAAPQITRHRMIVAETSGGAIAAFPPPHQYIYPLDHSFNLGFNWAGRDYAGATKGDGWGVCLPSEGDKRSAVWANAPPDTEQRLGVFYLFGRSPPAVFEAVKRFTHGDHYLPLPGYKTFASHFHVEHTLDLLQRQEAAGTKEIPPDLMLPGFVRAFRAEGVDIVHLAEFHNNRTPFLQPAERLRQLHTLFSECARLSDDTFLLLPGEEANMHLGGHWMCLFPRPIDWVMEHVEGEPLMRQNPDGSRIYFVGSAGEVRQMVEAEGGLMWTAHPRIKSSYAFPDAYRDEQFFRSSQFLGAAWKAMPLDYSHENLGRRAFEVLDDLSNWGLRMQMPGEVDVFKVEPDHELYGHSNVNYLALDRLPRFADGWQPVLDALRGGKFFTTTGEVLLPEFSVNGIASSGTIKRASNEPLRVRAKLQWTFPLHHAEIVGGDGRQIFRHRVDLSSTRAFGTTELDEIVPTEGWRWIRLEVWDVAVNGAYTQPVWIE